MQELTITIALAVIALALGTTTAAYAANPLTDDPNRWGQLAKDVGRDREMGTHASNPPIDLDPTSPSREGIGNTARLFGGDHPSDLAATLCPSTSTDPLCVSSRP